MAFGKKKDKEQGEEAVKSNKGIMIVLFVLGLIVLGGAAFGGVYIFMKTSKTVEAQEVAVENAYVDLKEFTVNLNDEGGKRFFKGEISLGYDKTKTKLAEELKSNEVVVRDDIIYYLKGQKADYINNAANRDAIKKQLVEAINKDLKAGKINDVRFKNMLIQ